MCLCILLIISMLGDEVVKLNPSDAVGSGQLLTGTGNRPAIERLVAPYLGSSKFSSRHVLEQVKVDIPELELPRFTLTNEQYEDINGIIESVLTNDITVAEAFLKLRGGQNQWDGFIELVGFLLFWLWANSFYNGDLIRGILDGLGFPVADGAFVPGPGPTWGGQNHPPVQPGPIVRPSVPDCSSTQRQVVKPPYVPHDDFIQMTQEQKRQLTHPCDIRVDACTMKVSDSQGNFVEVEVPELLIGFFQTEHKVRKHGAVHGLPYLKIESQSTSNGTTKTEKNPDTTVALMDSIHEMPNREEFDLIIGTYQGPDLNDSRAFEAIFYYDDATQVVAVFNKNTGRFVTTCQLTAEERIELLTTQNFGGGDNWFETGKNLPPIKIDKVMDQRPDSVKSIEWTDEQKESFSQNQESISQNQELITSEEQGITPVDNFLKDVIEQILGQTLLGDLPSAYGSSPNPGSNINPGSNPNT